MSTKCLVARTIKLFRCIESSSSDSLGKNVILGLSSRFSILNNVIAADKIWASVTRTMKSSQPSRLSIGFLITLRLLIKFRN